MTISITLFAEHRFVRVRIYSSVTFLSMYVYTIWEVVTTECDNESFHGRVPGSDERGKGNVLNFAVFAQPRFEVSKIFLC